ncbi:MAG: ester cyclase [Bryobacteraceae bacterium]|nr:ester cyclase [Bryobacteraceae bacterium]
MSEANKDLVRRWTEEIWNQGNLPAIDEIVAADYVHNDPVQPQFKGREALKQHVAAVHASFPDIHYAIEDLIIEGDNAATRISYSGTHLGEWMGMAATGKRLEGTANVLLRIAAGKVAEIWSVWDAFGCLQTLGAAADPAVLAANKAIVRRYAENIHSGNNPVAFSLVADDLVMHSPHTPPINTRAEFEDYIISTDAAFNGLRVSVGDLIADGDKVALRFSITGTLTGEWKGIPPTGKAIEITGTGTYRLEAGKIAEMWIDWDALGAFQQLGAIPAMV